MWRFRWDYSSPVYSLSDRGFWSVRDLSTNRRHFKPAVCLCTPQRFFLLCENFLLDTFYFNWGTSSHAGEFIAHRKVPPPEQTTAMTLRNAQCAPRVANLKIRVIQLFWGGRLKSPVRPDGSRRGGGVDDLSDEYRHVLLTADWPGMVGVRWATAWRQSRNSCRKVYRNVSPKVPFLGESFKKTQWRAC